MYFDNDYHPGHEDPRDSCAVLCPECYGDVMEALEDTEQDVSEATERADFDPDCYLREYISMEIHDLLILSGAMSLVAFSIAVIILWER